MSMTDLNLYPQLCRIFMTFCQLHNLVRHSFLFIEKDNNILYETALLWEYIMHVKYLSFSTPPTKVGFLLIFQFIVCDYKHDMISTDKKF